MLTPERRSEAAGLTKALASRRSYSGQEQDAAEELKRYPAAKGFDRVRTDRWGSVTGIRRNRTAGKGL